MKRKIVMTLCVVACVGMLFGCGQKAEEPSMEEALSETVEAPEEEGNADENPPEEAAAELDSAGVNEVKPNAAPADSETAPADSGAAPEEGQKEAYTADEIIEMLSQPQQDIIFAIRRDDLFYPLVEKFDYAIQTTDSDGNTLAIVEADCTVPTINYSQGEALVIFRDVNYGALDIAKVLDTSEHYCLPVLFQTNDKNEYITISSTAGSSFIDVDTINSINNNSIKYTEYEGNLVPEKSMNYLMEGEKDEVKELGGYEGSVYKSVQIKCTARYFITAPSESYSEQVQPTKDGYEILSDGSINPLENGMYAITINPWYIFEVINE